MNITCKTCCGNGEIVTDWDRYLKPFDGDVEDETVAECPECGGYGVVEDQGAADGTEAQH